MSTLSFPHSSKVKITLLLVSFLMTATFVACKKESAPQTLPTPVQAANPDDTYNVAFSRVLAKAVNTEPGLRSFIKTEAAKQFDKDYDILYQVVKDKKLNKGHTLHETLLKYADDAQVFNTACNMLPLLTIYVPELPNFSAENWDAQTQIPMVAVKQRNKAGVSIYDATGNERVLEAKYIPGFPVLVIKTNERVITNGTASYFADAHARQQNKTFYSNDKYSFVFADEAFNGLDSKVPDKSVNRVAFSMDQQNIDAYNSGVEWHRDFVYYGITPTNTTGKFSNHYSEFITSFNFTKPEHLGLINDHTDDPKVLNNTLTAPAWTDGRFEIRISIFINAKNAVGQELRKYFTATGRELFDIQYDSAKIFGTFYIYSYKSVSPKVYYPNIEILPWDLELYGSVWKFAVSEFDPSEEITRTVTNTTTYGSNFELSIGTGDKLKIGGKFGASATTTHTESYQYKTTTGSDDLAEGVLDFRSPIITAVGHLGFPFNLPYYVTYEVSTGIVSFSVEPKKVY